MKYVVTVLMVSVSFFAKSEESKIYYNPDFGQMSYITGKSTPRKSLGIPNLYAYQLNPMMRATEKALFESYRCLRKKNKGCLKDMGKIMHWVNYPDHKMLTAVLNSPVVGDYNDLVKSYLNTLNKSSDYEKIADSLERVHEKCVDCHTRYQLD